MHRFIDHRKTSRYNLSTIWTFWQIYIRLMLFRTSQLCTTYKDVVIFSCLLFVSWNIRLPNGSRLFFLSFLSIKYNIYTNRKWLMFSQTENSFRRNCSDTRACNNQSVFRVIHIGVWDNNPTYKHSPMSPALRNTHLCSNIRSAFYCFILYYDWWGKALMPRGQSCK